MTADICCCGMYPFGDHPLFILDGVLHERPGVPQAFCGSVLDHEIRNAGRRLALLEVEVQSLQDELREKERKLEELRKG